MPDIFRYTDYRLFLADYYKERKVVTPAYSFQVLSEKAGFASRGFLHNVMTGVKNLSRAGALKLAPALRLSAKEADYFETLVAFNQAKTLRERNHHFARLRSFTFRGKGATALRETGREHYAFYSAWYISAIRSLIDLHPFSGDYDGLDRTLFPAIKPRDAKRAVAILENLGMIHKKRDGSYAIADKTITAGSEIVALGLQNFQLQTLELAKSALQELPKEKRNISGLTLGISERAYQAICAEISEFQSRLLAIAEADGEADTVYQLNFHFFPMSTTPR